MQSILLEFELQPNWRASIVACKLPVLSALRRFSVLVGGRLAFRRIIRRKATTRASLHFVLYCNSVSNFLFVALQFRDGSLFLVISHFVLLKLVIWSDRLCRQVRIQHTYYHSHVQICCL